MNEMNSSTYTFAGEASLGVVPIVVDLFTVVTSLTLVVAAVVALVVVVSSFVVVLEAFLVDLVWFVLVSAHGALVLVLLMVTVASEAVDTLVVVVSFMASAAFATSAVVLLVPFSPPSRDLSATFMALSFFVGNHGPLFRFLGAAEEEGNMCLRSFGRA